MSTYLPPKPVLLLALFLVAGVIVAALVAALVAVRSRCWASASGFSQVSRRP